MINVTRVSNALVIFRVYGINEHKLMMAVVGTRHYLKKMEAYVSTGNIYEMVGCKLITLEMVLNYAELISQKNSNLVKL